MTPIIPYYSHLMSIVWVRNRGSPMPNWCTHARMYEIVMQFRVRPQLNYAQVKSMCAIKMCVHVVRNALAKKALDSSSFVRTRETITYTTHPFYSFIEQCVLFWQSICWLNIYIHVQSSSHRSWSLSLYCDLIRVLNLHIPNK